MIARITGGVLVTLGAALAALPGLTWFAGPPPGTPTHASGFAGSGQLWLLPVLGLMVLLAGVGLLASRPELGPAVARWAGPLALAGGLAALGFAVWAAVDPAVTLRVALPDGTEVVPATVTLAAAAIATPIVAGVAAAIGAATTWVGWTR